MTVENRGSTLEVQMRSKFQTSTLNGSNELNLRKCLKCGGLSGGPGRTRICDLYRVKVNISVTYRPLSRVFIHLQPARLDAIWTPRPLPCHGMDSVRTPLWTPVRPRQRAEPAVLKPARLRRRPARLDGKQWRPPRAAPATCATGRAFG